MAETWRVSRLEVQINYREDIPIVTASGECDLITSRKLSEAVESLLATGHCRLIFDLRNMSYIDSSGFRTLLVAKKKALEKGGDIVLISPSPPVERVYKLLHLDEMIARADSIEAAVGSLRRFTCQ